VSEADERNGALKPSMFFFKALLVRLESLDRFIPKSPCMHHTVFHSQEQGGSNGGLHIVAPLLFEEDCRGRRYLQLAEAESCEVLPPLPLPWGRIRPSSASSTPLTEAVYQPRQWGRRMS
jgi:hypothetical protein